MPHVLECGLSLPPSDVVSADTLLEQIALVLLHTCVFEAETAAQIALVPGFGHRAQHYITTHLREPLDVAAFACAVNITPQHLLRSIRRHVGTTPARSLWQMRMRHGVQLLRQTGFSITEIAAQTGFQSPFCFSRMVKHHDRCSPRQLRAQGWRGEHAPSP